MGKVVGKDLEFWFDGIEHPVVSVSPATEFDTEDTTDTATPGDGKDFEVIRGARSFNIEAIMYEPAGAEINTGTLVAGVRYRVTAKDTVLAAYDVGQLFEAAGTEVMSATDKVVPLGAKVTGKAMSFEFDSSPYPVRELGFNLAYDELDGTDSETTGDAKETEVSRAERETTLSAIMRDEDADLLSSNPTAEDVALELSATTKVEGTAIVTTKNITNPTTGFAEVNYSLKWKGVPTETNFGLAAGVQKAFKLIFKRGVVTNKEYTGNAVITAKSVSCNVSGVARITYTVRVNGAQTENVKTDA
ncbi:MAG: hypothetical protein KGZ85_08065 [Ignavibacterium sp.]|nr:hypothetical protein [Ignavibacterium sp.]